MRRIVVLALLFGGMQLIMPLGAAGQGSEALLAFGFLILAAYTVGELAKLLHLPKIVGYLLAGLAFGPGVLGVVDQDGAARLSPISSLAIALIAFLAGSELRWAEVRERGVLLLKIMSTELFITFLAISGLILAIHDYIPILRGAPTAQVIAFTLLFASIAIVHSPAVTMALLTETRARGPVARTTLGVVLLADLVVVLLFSVSLVVARSIAPPGSGGPGLTPAAASWEIAGATIVGAAIGAGVALYLRFVGRELMLFAVLVAFFGIEIAQLTQVELLLTMLTAGFVAENFSQYGDELRTAMERSAAPVFVVFFALSGAEIDLQQLQPLLPLVLPIAAVRATGIFVGTRVGGRWARAGQQERRFVWMGLFSQAGVAIGLATIVADAYPVLGNYLRGLLLALIAVNESVGPILFRRALARSGEDRGEEPDAPLPAGAAVAGAGDEI